MNANDISLTQVDTLGMLLAQIAELTKQADAIKDSIKDAATSGGATVVEGNLFKATVVEANRKVTDWKAIAKVCNIPEDVIIANTSITAVFSVKTTSR
jgi:N-formylglutamate amidohydrolase